MPLEWLPIAPHTALQTIACACLFAREPKWGLDDRLSDKTETRQAMTFAELAVQRLEKGDPLRPGTQRDYGHVLNRDILPVIGLKPAKAVTRDDIIDVLDRISAAPTGVPTPPAP